jgi:outer membrane lipoprotein-sorting protein
MSNFSNSNMSHRGELPVRYRTRLLASILLSACAVAALAATDTKPAPAGLTAAQIVDRHVAARGGLKAWLAVQTLSVSGKVDAGAGDSVERSMRVSGEGPGAGVKRGRAAARAAAAGAAKGGEPQQVQLPFRLDMKRPHKSRFELDFAGKTAVQVYDGERGWKLRPFLNRQDVEPFTESEAKAEAAKGDLEGPLVNYQAKGTQVALEGTEQIDGHNAYKLKVSTRSGEVQHVWIDAQSFLDVKVEGTPRRMDGKMRNVSVYQRDFRKVNDLAVPYLYVTVIEGNPTPHRMVVESVTVNPALDDARFGKPQVLVAGSPAASPAKPAPAGK